MKIYFLLKETFNWSYFFGLQFSFCFPYSVLPTPEPFYDTEILCPFLLSLFLWDLSIFLSLKCCLVRFREVVEMNMCLHSVVLLFNFQ